ncbi:hypothetical protein BJ912DRAFT_927045 [Pholiota molesta]|nr:hypothetical protein BJ912DRAFT_927045 [Pholiota molesta]
MWVFALPWVSSSIARRAVQVFAHNEGKEPDRSNDDPTVPRQVASVRKSVTDSLPVHSTRATEGMKYLSPIFNQRGRQRPQASTSSREGSGGKRVKKGERGAVLIAEQQEKKESKKETKR